MNDSVVAFGQVYEQPNGVAVVHPLHRSLRVGHLESGQTVISFTETGGDPVLFTLSPAQCAHFAAVLLAPHAGGGSAKPVAEQGA